MNPGIAYALSAFGLWGLIPIYFKLLSPINSLEVLAWRVLCSLGFVVLLLALQRNGRWLMPALRNAHVLRVFLASSVLIGMNWYIFIWAVGQGRVVETALGYFINPLVNVLVGAVWLHERLRRLQWAAVALAACGVLWITMHHGSLPWVALTLALSFAAYGLLRRSAPLGALEGLTLETLALTPLALGGLLVAWIQHVPLDIAQASTALQWLVLGSGPATAIPLLLFAAGARRLPFSMLGMLQYLGPTISLNVGVWLYDEPFAGARVQGFVLIWLACGLFSLDLWWHGRRQAQASLASTQAGAGTATVATP